MTKQSFRVILSVLIISIHLATAFIAPHPKLLHRHLDTSKTAYDLNSAFEWLSEERYEDPGYDNIQWLDLAPSQNIECEDDTTVLPLYPLGAAYVPSGVNQTLNNVEPQNLQMAQDLLLASNSPPRFCVTLRAMDTGRLAHIGTVMRILEADEQYLDGKLIRIRLTCCPEKLVEIRHIFNPEVFSPENRLRKSSEYLLARVRPIAATDPIMDDDLDDDVTQMIHNFNMVKTIYQLQIGGADFPPSALFQLGNAMSTWDMTNFSSTLAFWQAAQEWQSVCYTIRQGKQAMLSINRNELMVEAAAALGPLKLPIHLEDLPPQVRRQVQMMELDFQKEFFALGMDPCLDFQALLSLPDTRERVLCLAQWVTRERGRLEAVATKMSKARR